MVSRMITAATMGRNVMAKDNTVISFLSTLDISQRPHGMTTDKTAIQNTSTTKFDRETVDPMFEMPSGNHAMTPVNG